MLNSTCLRLSAPRGGVRLFWWVRRRSWRTGLLELLHMPVKLVVVLVTWSVLLAGLYLLAYQGLSFIYQTSGVGPFLLSRLWFLLLFVIALLLATSQLVSVYSTLVRAPETRFWMTLPVSARTLCRAKWLESSVYSGWAVLMLILPLYLAYLRILQQPLWIVGWAAAVFVPFMGIATALATIAILVWLRWCGKLVIRKELVPFGFVLACAALFWFLGERQHDTQQDAWFLTLQALLPRMQIAMSMWWPSSWTATALDAGINQRWREGIVYLGLLWTTLLVCWRVLDHLAAWLLWPVLRRYAQPTQSTGQLVRVGSPRWLAWYVPWWAKHPLLASIAKDVLLVLRDPIQWGQGVVFFGLLGAYFGNIHRLGQLSGHSTWRMGIASLNLACTLLVFGSLAVRFVFPQMSLEGRRLWLLRIAPNGMEQLLRAKLYLYSVLAVTIVDGLLLLSASRLGVPLLIRGWLLGIGTLAAVTIVGLTVGLGACWIDPTAQDAARMVSSSSGALVLVLMLLYVMCVVLALVAVWTLVRMGHAAFVPFIGVGLGLIVVSVLMGWVPVRVGLATLHHLEHRA